MNEFTRFSTRWIVTTIYLSKPSVTTHHIFTRASIPLSNTYKRQVQLAPKYMLYLLSFFLINLLRIAPWCRNM